MAIVQKIRTNVSSFIRGIFTAFIAFTFGGSLLMAFLTLTPLTLFCYVLIVLGAQLKEAANSVQIRPMFHRGRAIYRKLTADINMFKPLMGRKRLIDNF